MAHAHPLAREFFEIVEESRRSLRSIAGEMGVHAKTLSSWKKTNSPNVTSLEAALNVLGYRLVILRMPRQ